MTRPRLSLAAFCCLLVIPLAVACGGGSSNKSTPTASGSNATSATSSTAASKTTSSATTAPANGLSDLQKAAKDLSTVTYKVSYDSTITDASGKTTTGSMTLAHKASKSLMSFNGTFGGSTGTTTIIDDGTSTYLCTDQGSKTCLKSTSTGGAANPLIAFKPDTLVNTFSKNGYQVQQIGGQTIAGRAAKCYSAKGPDGSGTLCLDSKNGMLLSVDATDTSNGQTTKTVLKATTATDSPADTDFTPPYPVVSLPGR